MKRNIRFELNNRANRNGEYNVQLLVSVDGKRRKQKTPIYVQRKSDFNASAKGAKWIRQSVHNAELLNNELAKLMEKAQKSAFELNDANKQLEISKAISENIEEVTQDEEKMQTIKDIASDIIPLRQ